MLVTQVSETENTIVLRPEGKDTGTKAGKTPGEFTVDVPSDYRIVITIPSGESSSTKPRSASSASKGGDGVSLEKPGAYELAPRNSRRSRRSGVESIARAVR